jgi:hypothetical protein
MPQVGDTLRAARRLLHPVTDGPEPAYFPSRPAKETARRGVTKQTARSPPCGNASHRPNDTAPRHVPVEPSPDATECAPSHRRGPRAPRAFRLPPR